MSVEYVRLKKQLLQQMRQLEEEMDGLTTSPGENVGYGNHMADDASFAFEQTKSLALQQNLKSTWVQVKDALARFEQGTYGVCTRCGQSIDMARLDAIPYTALCITCAQQNHK